MYTFLQHPHILFRKSTYKTAKDTKFILLKQYGFFRLSHQHSKLFSEKEKKIKEYLWGIVGNCVTLPHLIL